MRTVLLRMGVAAALVACDGVGEYVPRIPVGTGGAVVPPPPGGDETPAPDAAPPIPDAAPPNPDAAPPNPDAAPPEPDAAPSEPDAAPPPPDAALPPIEPEICNGLDDDRDGHIDEGTTRPCYGGPPGTEGVGPCHAGWIECDAPAGTPCHFEVVPVPEPVACDGRDDDCNGLVDDLPDAPSCEAGAGACARSGVSLCGRLLDFACEPAPGVPVELCGNFRDDDCDGATDEAVGAGPVLLADRATVWVDWASSGATLGVLHLTRNPAAPGTWFVRFDAAGAPLGPAVRLPADLDAGEFALAAAGAGWVAAYRSGNAVAVRFLSADAGEVAPSILLGPEPDERIPQQIDVAGNAQGAMVVWTSAPPGDAGLGEARLMGAFVRPEGAGATRPLLSVRGVQFDNGLWGLVAPRADGFVALRGHTWEGGGAIAEATLLDPAGATTVPQALVYGEPSCGTGGRRAVETPRGPFLDVSLSCVNLDGDDIARRLVLDLRGPYVAEAWPAVAAAPVRGGLGEDLVVETPPGLGLRSAFSGFVEPIAGTADAVVALGDRLAGLAVRPEGGLELRPLVAETCNGRDDDCDAAIDESPACAELCGACHLRCGDTCVAGCDSVSCWQHPTGPGYGHLPSHRLVGNRNAERDACGRVVRNVVCADGDCEEVNTFQVEFDADGNVVFEAEGWMSRSGDSNDLFMSHRYDAQGFRTETIGREVGDFGPNDEFRVVYTNDPLGRVVREEASRWPLETPFDGVVDVAMIYEWDDAACEVRRGRDDDMDGVMDAVLGTTPLPLPLP